MTNGRGQRGGLVTGFTLVELLVVIGIIAVLVGMLLPALNRARKQAQTAQCLSNLKTLGQAMVMYTSQNKGILPPSTATNFLPGSTVAEPQTEIWDVKLAPLMGVKMVPDSAGRDSIPAGFESKVLICPSDYRIGWRTDWFLRSYAGIRLQDGKKSNTTPAFTQGPFGNGDFVGTMWTSGKITQPDGSIYQTLPVQISKVKRPQEVMYLFDHYSFNVELSTGGVTEGNRQWRSAFASGDPPLGAGAKPLSEALENKKGYHNKRINMLFVDGHAASEDPNEFHRKKWFWRSMKY